MKRFVFCFLVLLVAQGAWANLQAVTFANLAKYDLLSADIQYLQANRGKFDHWSAEWTYPDSKQDCLQLLQGASSRVEALVQKAPDEIDLSLLLLVVYQYRYNLDDNKVVGSFRRLAAGLEQRFPQDYRPVWVEAVFQANAGKSVEAIGQFQQILVDRSQLALVHPALLYDYAQACYLATMLRTAKIVMQAYLQRTGLQAHEVPLAPIINERVLLPNVGGSYKPEEVWQLAPDGSQIRFSSNMLATAFSVPGDWKPRIIGYQNSQSVVVLTPPPIKSKLGKSITINLVLVQSTRQQEFSMFASGFEQSMGQGYGFSPASLALPASANQKVDRVTNSALYVDRSGMSGYAVFLGNPARADGGFNVDLPNAPPKSGEQSRFFKVVEQFDRFDVGINTVLLVDSCVEIAEETDALVATFLKSLRAD